MKDEYDFSQGKRGTIDPAPAGKTRITIRLDDEIIAWFRQQAEQAGGGTHSPQLLEQYKSVVRNEFFPARGFGEARLSIARKAVNDYKKVSDSHEGLIDLMLFYVEMGVRYTNAYGDINESFYSSMESMYERATKHIAEHNLRDQFQQRCRRIVSDTSGIGWGFHDTLCDIYNDYFVE
jgi:hypothetical protein